MNEALDLIRGLLYVLSVLFFPNIMIYYVSIAIIFV